MSMRAEDLIAFEQEMVAEFEAGHIKAPLHLAGGNEHQLIDIFREIGPEDWCLTSWRSHYHCLLKGVPPERIKEAIRSGRSIALCFPTHRVLSSAIVGGICPIAAGLGWAIRERGGHEKVHVFVGDMTAMSGIYQECRRYCAGNDLPVKFWIEDNGLSVCTDTQAVWGKDDGEPNQVIYQYKLTRPHVGVGKFVRF